MSDPTPPQDANPRPAAPPPLPEEVDTLRRALAEAEADRDYYRAKWHGRMELGVTLSPEAQSGNRPPPGDIVDFQFGAKAAGVQHAPLSDLTAPEVADDREVLERAVFDALIDLPGDVRLADQARTAADAILAAGFRRSGSVAEEAPPAQCAECGCFTTLTHRDDCSRKPLYHDEAKP